MTDKEIARLAFAKSSKSLYPRSVIDRSSKIHWTALIGGSIWINRWIYFLLWPLLKRFVLDGFGWAKDHDGTLVKVNHSGNVVICANVEIRAFCKVDRAVTGSTFIDEGSKFDHGCHVAHGVKIGKNNTFAAHSVIEGSCIVGNGNTFGTNVVIQKKLKVGDNCTIGSGTVITKDVPDNAVLVGVPGKILRFKE